MTTPTNSDCSVAEYFTKTAFLIVVRSYASDCHEFWFNPLTGPRIVIGVHDDDVLGKGEEHRLIDVYVREELKPFTADHEVEIQIHEYNYPEVIKVWRSQLKETPVPAWFRQKYYPVSNSFNNWFFNDKDGPGFRRNFNWRMKADLLDAWNAAIASVNQ